MEELRDKERLKLKTAINYIRSVAYVIANHEKLKPDTVDNLYRIADLFEDAVNKAPRPYDQEWLPKLFEKW